jgi:hypothetical protein
MVFVFQIANKNLGYEPLCLTTSLSDRIHSKLPNIGELEVLEYGLIASKLQALPWPFLKPNFANRLANLLTAVHVKSMQRGTDNVWVCGKLLKVVLINDQNMARSCKPAKLPIPRGFCIQIAENQKQEVNHLLEWLSCSGTAVYILQLTGLKIFRFTTDFSKMRYNLHLQLATHK